MQSKKNKKNLDDLYSKNDGKHDKHMDLLFPKEGNINFGYWKSFSNPITMQERIDAQENLYELIFSILDLKQSDKILEVGFGRGRGIISLLEKGFDAFGLDALQEHVDRLKEKHTQTKNRLSHGLAEQLPYPKNEFDAIFSIEAAQHFTNMNDFIENCYRILKCSGKLVLTTFFFNSSLAKEKVSELIPESVEGTHNAQIITDVLNQLENSKFEINKVDKIGENVFPAYAHWQKQISQMLTPDVVPKDKSKWKSYFYARDELEHPWLTVFKKGWIDYYVVHCKKPA